jgi:hypothetical protein
VPGKPDITTNNLMLFFCFGKKNTSNDKLLARKNFFNSSLKNNIFLHSNKKIVQNNKFIYFMALNHYFVCVVQKTKM